MDFFGMGIGEILLILVIALLIWGPNKIPEIARMLGKTMSTLRKASFDLTSAIREETKAEEKEELQKRKMDGRDKAVKPEENAVEESREEKTESEDE
jgi:Tat protein translocase TatB subunit